MPPVHGQGRSRASPLRRLPIHPAKGQMMALKMDPTHPSPEHIVFRKEGYNIPRLDGRLVVGATFEEVGFDTTITVEGMLHLMRRVTETLPATGKLPLVEMWVGLRPRSGMMLLCSVLPRCTAWSLRRATSISESY